MKGHGARKPCRQLGCFGYLAFTAGAIAALIAEVVTRHAAPRVKVGADDGHRLEATGHHRLERACDRREVLLRCHLGLVYRDEQPGAVTGGEAPDASSASSKAGAAFPVPAFCLS